MDKTKKSQAGTSLCFACPPRMQARLRAEATRQDITLSQLLRRACDAYLNTQETK